MENFNTLNLLFLLALLAGFVAVVVLVRERGKSLKDYQRRQRLKRKL